MALVILGPCNPWGAQWTLIVSILFLININDIQQGTSSKMMPFADDDIIYRENGYNINHMWPLLLTWFNFNPSMDK